MPQPATSEWARTAAQRLARAVEDGDLPADTDHDALACHVMVVGEGNTVHAAAGTSREELHATVAVALRAVPRTGAGTRA
ncbi:hypothetical protein ACIP10_29460 [Streptomyces galbus]|uniref:hypothetical protein n=1 Tax=Streptomyces galbus TaxID=33898 RepID=UPI0037A548B2